MFKRTHSDRKVNLYYTQMSIMDRAKSKVSQRSIEDGPKVKVMLEVVIKVGWPRWTVLYLL